MERINENEEEKSDIKLERGDDGKESESRIVNEIISAEIQTGGKIILAAGSGFGQQSQPELETNDDRHDQESHSKHHQHQRRGQFGGMYSDVPGECRHNTAGKDSSREYQQNFSQENSGISGNTELQGNHQLQSTENQNHSRKQQQQDNTNRGYNQDYAGQQGHRKQNKRNKKSRNWFKQ